MQRRGFLQALLAAGAGLAGARAVVQAAPAAAPAKATTPQVAVTADTKPFRRNLDEAQRTVMEMLKECRVINASRVDTVHGHTSWTITYTHAPTAPRTYLDDQADLIAADRVPVSVTVTQHEQDVDIIELGGFYKTPVTKAGHDIEVEWR